jgi:hypothetical protein
MEEQKQTDQAADESLADVPPSPIAVSPNNSPAKYLMNTLVFMAGGVSAFLLLAGTLMPCVGATRSAKLKWEERKLEIEQAERDAQASENEQH